MLSLSWFSIVCNNLYVFVHLYQGVNNMKIAWIGTGIMGFEMVSHLCEANYDVSVYNRSAHKSERLKHIATVCTSIKEVVKDADVIFSIVSLPSDVEQVYLKDGVLAYAKKRAICVDMTTSSPTLAQKISEQANHKGITVLDAPVSGGDVGAKNAALTIMVGGDKLAFDQILPLLELMGKSVTRVGASGYGQHMKMANQVAVANNLLGAVESLSYAKAVGLDQSMAIDVLSGGAAASWQLKVNGPLMIHHNFDPGFMNVHFIKDLKLVLEEAKKSNVSLPMIEKIVNMFLAHQEEDFQFQSTVAIYKDYIRS